MKRYIIRAVIMAAVVAASLTSSLPAAAQGVTKLGCVNLQVAKVTPDEERLGLNQSGVEARLLVLVRSKVPRLPVQPDCTNHLEVSVTVVASKNQAQQTTGYFGLLGVRVYRVAVVLGPPGPTSLSAGALDSVITWDRITVFEGGRRVSVQEHALEILERHIDAFAADYYRAGNN